jgi:hypothetical protein
MDFTVAPQTGRSAVWYASFIGYYAAIYNTLHTLQAPQHARAVIIKNARSLLASSEYCR